MAIIAASAAGVASAAAAPGDAKTMSADSWSRMTILGVGRDSSSRQPYYLRVAAGDIDGDGLADEGIVKLMCAGDELKEALYTVKSPRDLATGQATGKRQHGPVTFVKEWGPSTPQLSAIRPTYDVKTLKGGRSSPATWTSSPVGRASSSVSSSVGWIPISLSNADGLCAAARQASDGATASSPAASLAPGK